MRGQCLNEKNDDVVMENVVRIGDFENVVKFGGDGYDFVSNF